MKGKPAAGKKVLFLVGLIVICVLIKLFSLNSNAVEAWYSNGVYTGISRVLRVLFGWIPFSLGDIFYTIVSLWLIVLIFRFLRSLVKKTITRQRFLQGCGILFQSILILYIVFNVLWGLNYTRKGIAYQLQLQPDAGSAQELDSLSQLLLQKINSARRSLPQTVPYPVKDSCFVIAVEAYHRAQQQYPFLRYESQSVKSSLYNKLGDYLGFSGYYNPFSGEAQVNTSVPPFLIPYICCHEMAHQIGYASEDEANFVGYLAAKASPDPTFQYSVYFDLFNYTNAELYLHDSLAARNNYRRLDTLVKQDIQSYRQFLKRYKNPLEPLITKMYGGYLKANNQPNGIETYSDVVTWLIAYQKKYKGI